MTTSLAQPDLVKTATASSLHVTYLSNCQLLTEMLSQNPKTLIQCNQVNVYIKNHWSFVSTGRLNLVRQGWSKMGTYVGKLVQNVNE